MKKAIAMKCSQKDWDLIKSRFDVEQINSITSFLKYPYLTNIESNKIDNIDRTATWRTWREKELQIHETFNAKIFLNACGIDCEPEYSITKLQLTQLLKNNNAGNEQLVSDDLRAWFPDVFKKELEVGKWYNWKNDKALFNFQENGNIYGFLNGKWHITDHWTWNDFKNCIESTPQEIESALICEAKKRGFKDGGYYQWINCPLRKVYGSNFIFDKNILRINGFTIMDVYGKWAQIIETITIQEAEKLLNKKIV